MTPEFIMNPDDYQSLAMRTLCNQEDARERLAFSTDVTMANHAIIGLAGEVGELASFWQKLVYYGKHMTLEEVRQKIKDEAGDVLWYVAELLTSHGISMADVMQANIAKLKVRYPDKYSNERAADEARDRKAEADAVFTALAQHVPEPHKHDWLIEEEGGIGSSPSWRCRCGARTGGDHVMLPPCNHDWMLIQGPAGSGQKCKRCGQTEGF